MMSRNQAMKLLLAGEKPPREPGYSLWWAVLDFIDAWFLPANRPRSYKS